MSWFHSLCRNVGLMIHNIRHPDDDKKIVKHTVEEEREGNVILRRTTIEEIEYKASKRPSDEATKEPD